MTSHTAEKYHKERNSVRTAFPKRILSNRSSLIETTIIRNGPVVDGHEHYPEWGKNVSQKERYNV